MQSTTASNSKMPLEAREAHRKSSLRVIRRLLRHLYPPQHPIADRIDPDTYSRLPIKITSLPSDCHEIDFDVRFSKPMDNAKFDAIFAELYGEDGQKLSILRYSETKDGNRHRHSSTSWARATELAICCGVLDYETYLRSPDLLDYTQWCYPSPLYFDGENAIGECGPRSMWCVHDAYVVTQGKPKEGESYHDKIPHVACLLETRVPMKEGLSRGELIAILTIMHHRLRYRAWNPHATIPVFVYHFCDDEEARVTQAHFDGETLHLRQTEPILLSQQPLLKFKALLKWITAEPMGDTLFHDFKEPPCSDLVEPPESPKTPKKSSFSKILPVRTSLVQSYQELEN